MRVGHEVREVIGEKRMRPILAGYGDEDDVDEFNFTAPRKVYKFRRRALRIGSFTIPLGLWQEGRWA